MQRFFVTFPLSIDITLTDTDIIHQITRVLRMKEGDRIVLFDGGPAEIIYTITAITKKNVSLRGNEQKMPHTEPKKQIYLYQALPNKIEKIEYILQKGVEVGIAKFVFFRSQYSQKFVLSDAKKHRLETIAREALEQCGGLVMPEIVFSDEIALETRDYAQLVLDTTGNTSSLHEVNMHSKIALWVGPEGGWSESEIIKMKEKGYVFARFGERVLRTETAGVVVAFGFLHA